MSYQLLADELLVRLLKTSDKEAFKAIYDRYWKKMFFSALKKVKSKEVAEELTQNLFVRLWEKREQSSVIQLENYLSIAIKYSVINHIQASFSRDQAIKGANLVQVAHEATENKLLLNELNEAIQRAISFLPPKTQEVFKFNRLEHRSVKEIANLLNLSNKAVEYHITKSLKLMRFELKDFMLFEFVLLLLTNN